MKVRKDEIKPRLDMSRPEDYAELASIRDRVAELAGEVEEIHGMRTSFDIGHRSRYVGHGHRASGGHGRHH